MLRKPRARLTYASLTTLALAVLALPGTATAVPPPPYVAFEPHEVSPVSVGERPVAIVTADLDDDGYLDFATANADDGTVTVAFGDGGGGFSPVYDMSAGASSTSEPHAIVAADFDKNGLLDLATANFGKPGVSVLLQQSGREFSPRAGSPYAVGGGGAESIAAGDVDGDGDVDLAVTGATSAGASGAAVLLNTPASPGVPAGFPHASGSPISTGIGLGDVVLADFDGDGRRDHATNGVYVRRGVGDGTFGAPRHYDVSISGDVASGDVDGDGRPDLVIAEAGGDLSTLLARSNGGFDNVLSPHPSRAEDAMVIGKFNPDPYGDVLYTAEVPTPGGFGATHGDRSLLRHRPVPC